MRGREDFFLGKEEQIPTGPKLPNFLGMLPTTLPGHFPFQPYLSSTRAAA